MSINKIVEKRTSTKINDIAKKAYDQLRRKYRISNFWYVFLNIFTLTLVASLIILNVYAIRFNSNPNYIFTKKWFVVISCLNSFVGSMSALIAFLSIKPKMKLIEIALVTIQTELAEYSKKQNLYSNAKYRDELFLKRILEIIEEIIQA